MDDLGSNLPALTVILVLTVSGTVFMIQKLKMLVCTHWRGAWTQRIPKWLWLVLSLVVPFGLVVFMVQPWMQVWLNGILPETMHLAVSPQDVLGTGVAAVFGSQGSYALAKKLGLIGDYSAGGPNDVTLAAPGPAPSPEEAPVVPEPMPAGPLPAPEPVTAPAFPETGIFATPANVPKQETPAFAHLLAYCAWEPDLVVIDGDPPMVVPVKREEMKAWIALPPKNCSP